MVNESKSFIQTLQDIFGLMKASLTKHTVKEWVQIAKDQSREFYTDVCIKIKDLKKTNIELGQFHLHKGNFADAKFRFKFVKFFWPEVYEADYYLGRVYFFEKSFKKAKKYFDAYIASPNPNFAAEIFYCLNIIENHPDRIEEIPLSIIKENFDIRASSYENTIFSNVEESSQYLLTQSVLKFINALGKPAINKVLDLGCGTGLMGAFLKSKIVVSFLTGVDISNSMLTLAKELLTNDQKTYDEVLNSNVIDYMNALSSSEKFDIVLANGIFNYYSNIKETIEVLSIKAIDKSALFAFCIRVHEHEAFKTYESNFEEFSFSAAGIANLLQENNLNILHQELIKLPNQTTAMIIISQKI